MNVFIRVRARTCIRNARTRTRALNFQAVSRARLRAYVRSRESACVGLRALAGCCVYVSAARDASIVRTHLQRRRVFCSRTFRMYYNMNRHMYSTRQKNVNNATLLLL